MSFDQEAKTAYRLTTFTFKDAAALQAALLDLQSPHDLPMTFHDLP